MRQPEKNGNRFPLVRHRYSCDLGKVPCCQLIYITYVFKHCDLLALKIIIKKYCEKPCALRYTVKI